MTNVVNGLNCTPPKRDPRKYGISGDCLLQEVNVHGQIVQRQVVRIDDDNFQ